MGKATQDAFDKAANKLFNPDQKAFDEAAAKMLQPKKEYNSYKEYEEEKEDPDLDNESNWYSTDQKKFDLGIKKLEKKNAIISKVCNSGKTEAEFDQDNFDKAAQSLNVEWDYIDFFYDMDSYDNVYVEITRGEELTTKKVVFDYNNSLKVNYSFLKDGEIFIVHKGIIEIEETSKEGFFVCDQMYGNDKVVGAVLVKNGEIEIYRSSLEKAGFPVTRKTIKVTPTVDDYTKAFFLH